MERLTIDEIISHCKRRVRKEEALNGRDFFETELMGHYHMEEYWEHRQVAEYLEELKEYRKAEEQGLLKILPCPIGTMVHEPYRFCDDGAWEIDHHYLKLEDLDKIGKTVFVDENDANAYIAEQEEAESTLAEKGGA